MTADVCHSGCQQKSETVPNRWKVGPSAINHPRSVGLRARIGLAAGNYIVRLRGLDSPVSGVQLASPSPSRSTTSVSGQHGRDRGRSAPWWWWHRPAAVYRARPAGEERPGRLQSRGVHILSPKRLQRLRRDCQQRMREPDAQQMMSLSPTTAACDRRTAVKRTHRISANTMQTTTVSVTLSAKHAFKSLRKLPPMIQTDTNLYQRETTIV